MSIELIKNNWGVIWKHKWIFLSVSIMAGVFIWYVQEFRREDIIQGKNSTIEKNEGSIKNLEIENANLKEKLKAKIDYENLDTAKNNSPINYGNLDAILKDVKVDLSIADENKHGTFKDAKGYPIEIKAQISNIPEKPTLYIHIFHKASGDGYYYYQSSETINQKSQKSDKFFDVYLGDDDHINQNYVIYAIINEEEKYEKTDGILAVTELYKKKIDEKNIRRNE